MTYFEFLFLFVILPLIFILIINLLQSKDKFGFPPYLVIIALAITAFIYTTPWDNYLVAESIWFYDPNLVTGITLGWVPIEEYTFFIVQTLLVGLIFLFVLKYFPLKSKNKDFENNKTKIRFVSGVLTFLVWIPMVLFLIFRFDPSLTYLSLILAWGLIPLGMQAFYGADIIWLNKKVVFIIIAIFGTYLSVVDAIAINQGIWTISFSTSTGIMLGGILPIEEAIFFFLTTTLVVFGMVLILDKNSIKRAKGIFNIS